ncbi:MAG: glucosaminidase domain-containing protein [Chitinophagaceae bacterium]
MVNFINRRFIWYSILGFLLLTSTVNGQSNHQYIKKYTALAKQLSTQYKIPVPIILGIAAFESDYGRSKVAKTLNNHFGIEGKNHRIYKTRYRYFESVEASYESFCKMVAQKNYYKALAGNPKYEMWIQAMSESGYSEAPEIWAKRLKQVIINNKLNEL